MTTSNERTVTVTVDSVGAPDGKGMVALRFKCAEMHIGWALPMKVPVEADMVPGQSYLVHLKRGPLQKDKTGNPKSGQYDNEYFWNWGSFATVQEAMTASETTAPDPVPAAASQTAPESTQRASGGYLSDRERNDAIIGESAAKDATDLIVSGIPYYGPNSKEGERTPYQNWDGWFGHIQARIRGTTPPGFDVEPSPQPPDDYVPPGPDPEEAT